MSQTDRSPIDRPRPLPSPADPAQPRSTQARSAQARSIQARPARSAADHFLRPLPPEDAMYAAVVERDTRYEGIFVTAVTSTTIFCRPGCPARSPKRENVEFFRSAAEALANGYRPCKRCRPLEPVGGTPEPIRDLLREIDADPMRRLRDADLRGRGLEPRTVRRWFQRHHGMTFHGYQRARRLGRALGELSAGSSIPDAAYGNGWESLSGFGEALRRIAGGSPSARRDAVVVRLTRFTSPLGPMLLGATDEGVCLAEFADRRMLETQLARLRQRLNCVFAPGGNAMTERMEAELTAYFAGRLRGFETPLVLAGTDFQRQVWEGLGRIPYGVTRSYAEQARALGRPRAVRAVARANGDNRLAIVVPCHRVVGSDGRLTGYGGGLWRKRWLLHHESS